MLVRNEQNNFGLLKTKGQIPRHPAANDPSHHCPGSGFPDALPQSAASVATPPSTWSQAAWCRMASPNPKWPGCNIYTFVRQPQDHWTSIRHTLKLVFLRVRSPPIHRSARITWLQGWARRARWLAATARERQLWFDQECSSQVSSLCAFSASWR